MNVMHSLNNSFTHVRSVWSQYSNWVHPPIGHFDFSFHFLEGALFLGGGGGAVQRGRIIGLATAWREIVGCMLLPWIFRSMLLEWPRATLRNGEVHPTTCSIQSLPLNKTGYVLTFRAGLLRCYNVQVGGGGVCLDYRKGLLRLSCFWMALAWWVLGLSVVRVSVLCSNLPRPFCVCLVRLGAAWSNCLSSRVTRAGFCSGWVRVVFGVCSCRWCDRWVSVSTICLSGLDVFLCWVS